MQKLIKEQVSMHVHVVKILLLLFFLLQVGCTALTSKVNSKKLSCEEEVKPKSLEYLEQQYRCTTSK
jgi:hypothetical protein